MTEEQLDVEQMRYWGLPWPLRLTVCSQPASMPVMSTISEEYCVDVARLFWSVKEKEAGIPSQMLVAMQFHENPSHNSTQPCAELYLSPPEAAALQVVEEAPIMIPPPPLKSASICARAGAKERNRKSAASRRLRGEKAKLFMAASVFISART